MSQHHDLPPTETAGSRICFRNRCISVWLAFTIAWALTVFAVIASRLNEHVAASRDLAAEIAALDCSTTATCAHDESLVTPWADLAALVIEYRGPLLLEITLLPPLAALGIALFVYAWRCRRGPAAAGRARPHRRILAQG